MLAKQKFLTFGECGSKCGLCFHHCRNACKEHHRIFFNRREHLQERIVQGVAKFRSGGLRQEFCDHHGTALVHIGGFRINAHERLFTQTQIVHAHFLQIVREVGLHRKRRRGECRGLDPRIEFFSPDVAGMERERMQLDGMRIEGFFHVEHPIAATTLCYKFKVRNKVADFGHTAFEIAHDAFERVFSSCNKFFCQIAGSRVLFEEGGRVSFEFCEDAVCICKAAAAVFLLGKFLADFHEEAVQGLFGFAQSFGEFVTKFMKFRLFRRDAACNFYKEAIATGLGRFERLCDVPESKERNGAAKHLVADFGQAVRFVKDDVFVCREQRKIELQVRKEK